MIEPKNLQTGIPYKYDSPEGQKVGVIQNIIPSRDGNRNVVLDNGDTVGINRFCRMATPLNEQQPPDIEQKGISASEAKNEGNQGGNQPKVVKTRRQGGGGQPSIPIQTDDEGNPILPGQKGAKSGDKTKKGQNKDIIESKNLRSKNKVEKDEDNEAILKLLNKAKTKKGSLKVEVPIKLINQNLYDTILESFDDSEQTIHNFLMNTIDKEELREKIKKQIRKKYGKKGKG